MNGKSTASGRTGFAWARSLLSFRHRNPLARFVSSVVAFAIATLLVVGSGAAYAEDLGPVDPAATQSSTDPAPDPAADTSATPADAPVVSSLSPADTSTPVDSPAPASAPSLGKKSVTTAPLALAAVPSLQALVTPLANTGNFEIDGDTEVNNGGNDWAEYPSSIVAGEGYRDADGYQGSNKQEDSPIGWSGAQVATEKMDMVKLWVKTLPSGPRGVFGIQRDAANGTTAYFFEYNQRDNLPGNVAKPDRQPNDVMFTYLQTGNSGPDGTNKLTFQQGYVYVLKDGPGWNAPNTTCTLINGASPAGGWCTLSTDDGTFYGATSDGTGTFAEGIFAEGVVDFSKLHFPAGTCRGALGTLNVRSQSSLSWSSAMQDFAVADVNVEPTCGSLTIQKKGLTGDTLIPGAAYSIVDDPRPEQTGTYNVFDGTPEQLAALTGSPTLPANTVADGMADGKIVVPSAEPGTYTVTELRAPSGYLLPADRDQQVVVGNADATTAERNPVIAFRDPKKWQPLTATKTADGHYDIGWSILKQVTDKADPVEADWSSSATADSPSTSHDFKYRVRVTQQAASNYRVTGSVTVHNPNGASVSGTLTEVPGLSDAGGVCTFDAGHGIAAAGGAITVDPDVGSVGTDYPYTCTFASPPAQGAAATGTNTAHLEWSSSTYPQNQGDVDGTVDATRVDRFQVNPSDGYAFVAADGQPTSITIKDVATVGGNPVQHDFTAPELSAGSVDGNGDWTLTWTPGGGPYTATYTRTITGTSGECTEEGANPNTATIYQTGTLDSLGSSTANAQLCVGAKLVVSKNKTVDMTRTYLWKIDKTRTSAAQINSGQSASYSVTVSRGDGDGFQDSGWTMDGTVTVTNPNDWQSVTMSSLVDHYSGDNDYVDGNEATNSCAITGSRVAGTSTWGSVDLSLDPSQVMEYQYHCEFTAKPDYTGTNAATATWNAAAAHTVPDAGSANSTSVGTAGVVDSDWTTAADPVNKTITVTDDQYDDGLGGHVLGTLDWNDAPHTYTYSITWTVPAGTCADKPNTATIVETEQSDSATVKVCNPVDLTVSKTADGSFTRTYLWDLDKLVVGSARSADDSYDHTFDYLVTLKENGTLDSAWKVHGTITVTNHNTDSDIPDYTASVTDAMTGVGGSPSCQWNDGKGEPEAQWPDMPASVTLASGTHADIDYVCSFLTQPTYSGGTNKATATWTGGTASSSDVPVSFAETNSVDKTVHVVDNKTTGTFTELPNSPVTYGSHGSNGAWVAADSLYEFTYDVPLTYDPEVGGDCQDFPNTARVLGDGAVVLDHADASVSICPKAGTWEVSKDVAEPFAVTPGTTLHYTLTAHKTSVVDPKGVKVYDDLSDIAGYITGEPVLSNPDASYDPSTHILTWDVGTLSGTETLDFSVVVRSDAYGVDLPNLITSPGSDNCDPQVEGFPADECDTDNATPHYTLRKTSDAGPQVMPPYLGDPGTVITYTLTVHNDSAAPINGTTMPGEQVTDDLTAVLDNATWVGNITPGGQAEFDGDHTLTWTLPALAADDGAPGGPDEATLTYQVQVNGDQWDETLTNVAHHGPGGNCVPVAALVAAPVEDNANCTTTTVTPPYALIRVNKVDAENPDVKLEGAEFTLSQQGKVLHETGTTGADGVLTFTTKLQPGTYQVTETKAPEGYSLPATTTRDVEVLPAALDNGEVPVEVTFDDPPTGDLSITKAHQERSGGSWVAGDGQVAFGDEIKYVMTVTATGPKVFHDVTVTDYVPGWNPADHTTAPAGTKGELESGTITCGGAVTCTSSYNAATGLITWHLTGAGDDTGDVRGDVGTVEFVVRMPDIPNTSPLAGPGVSFAAVLWNQATLLWSEFGDEAPDTHSLPSNAVTDAANATLPPEVKPPQVSPPAALPNTGGPDAWLLLAGLVLLLGGGVLIAGDRRRRRRS
jgi:LPXTG-motif cell wall-anchored protein